MINTANGKSVKTLIHRARQRYESDAALARALNMSPPTLNQMKLGTRTISPETVGLLCDMLELSGDEAREWLAVSVIEAPKNQPIRERLRAAFFACWALGAVLLTASNDATAKTAEAVKRLHGLYIVRNAMLGLRLRRRSAGLRPEPLTGLVPSGC